jgi:hypothetical protein
VGRWTGTLVLCSVSCSNSCTSSSSHSSLPFFCATRVFGDREIRGARPRRTLHTAPFFWMGFPRRSPAAEAAQN